MEELRKLRKKVKKTLEKSRYEHTLGVMYTAASLAMCYETDIEKAMIAGLLHDCAKSIPNDEKYILCKQYHIELNEIEWNNPELIHAKLGGFLAYEIYEVYDIEIRNAIKNHTTGCPNMTMLDKITFVADYIEPHRKQPPMIEEIRKIAFQNIDMALYLILKQTLNYLENTKKPIDQLTQETYEYYKDQLTETLTTEA